MEFEMLETNTFQNNIIYANVYILHVSPYVKNNIVLHKSHGKRSFLQFTHFDETLIFLKIFLNKLQK